MKAMQVVLVGARNGRRVVRWQGIMIVSLFVFVVGGGVATLTSFLLLREFNLVAVLFPVLIVLGALLVTGIRRGLACSVEQLPRLDCAEASKLSDSEPPAEPDGEDATG